MKLNSLFSEGPDEKGRELERLALNDPSVDQDFRRHTRRRKAALKIFRSPGNYFDVDDVPFVPASDSDFVAPEPGTDAFDNIPIIVGVPMSAQEDAMRLARILSDDIWARDDYPCGLCSPKYHYDHENYTGVPVCAYHQIAGLKSVKDAISDAGDIHSRQDDAASLRVGAGWWNDVNPVTWDQVMREVEDESNEA